LRSSQYAASAPASDVTTAANPVSVLANADCTGQPDGYYAQSTCSPIFYHCQAGISHVGIVHLLAGRRDHPTDLPGRVDLQHGEWPL
jgi:hypothetical protein